MTKGTLDECDHNECDSRCEMKNYYKAELGRLEEKLADTDAPDYCKAIKVWDGFGSSTKTLNLNAESIPVLIEFLQAELVRLQKEVK